MAIGLALSPLPLIAIFMLLMTPHAKQNGIAFLVGWFFGIILICLSVILIPDSINTTWKTANTSGNMQVVFGILMFVGAILVKQKGSKRKDPIKVPKIFKSIDKFGVKRSLSLGFLLSSLNIKNLALAVAGAIQIKTVINGSYFESFTTIVLFSIISSLTIITPVCIYIFSQEKMDRLFMNWRNWLIRNQSLILVFVLVFFGGILIYLGLKLKLNSF